MDIGMSIEESSLGFEIRTDFERFRIQEEMRIVNGTSDFLHVLGEVVNLLVINPIVL